MIELYTTMPQFSDLDYAILMGFLEECCSKGLCERLKKKTEVPITPTNEVDTAEADFMEIFGPSSDETNSELIETPEKKS